MDCGAVGPNLDNRIKAAFLDVLIEGRFRDDGGSLEGGPIGSRKYSKAIAALVGQEFDVDCEHEEYRGSTVVRLSIHHERKR
jgi:hypothetical protein